MNYTALSCQQAAERLLAACVARRPWDRTLIRRLLVADCGGALFSTVAESLSDSFDSYLCDRYADLFSDVLEIAFPDLQAGELRARYERIRRPRTHAGDIEGAFVLSR